MRKNSWFLAMKWLRQRFEKLLRCMNQPQYRDRVFSIARLQCNECNWASLRVTWLRWPGVRAYVYAGCTTATERRTLRLLGRSLAWLCTFRGFRDFRLHSGSCRDFRLHSGSYQRLHRESERSQRATPHTFVHRSVTVYRHQPTKIPDLGEF